MSGFDLVGFKGEYNICGCIFGISLRGNTGENRAESQQRGSEQTKMMAMLIVHVTEEEERIIPVTQLPSLLAWVGAAASFIVFY